MQRKILVTSALPYANGDIHLGHLVEYIQTDIWVRFQKMNKHEVHYVCADDTHGTAIMLRAENEKIDPLDLINNSWKEHAKDFKDFNVNFDYYGSTNDEATKKIAEDTYLYLKDKSNLIYKKEIEQFYDLEAKLFLPDRYIKGECPKCNAKDQYGDSCEICGSTYNSTELINPYSVVSGTKPQIKKSEHFFFKLSDDKCTNFLKNWTQTKGHLQKEALNKIKEWFQDGLNDWDISRDEPYFGFKIPETNNKFFYVWLDAPIGYLGSFKNLCTQKKIDFDKFIDKDKAKDSKTELIHFIGKDILYFHALFWPAILEFSQKRTPSKIFAHGFLTINGKKMSKSRGTFISAKSYINKKLNPEYLRYYYASKLSSSLEDIDLNLTDFIQKVNSDLVGKYINIASRCARFLNNEFSNCVLESDKNQVIKKIVDSSQEISHHFELRKFNKAISLIMSLVDKINAYIDEKKPWNLLKNKSDKKEVHQVCSNAIEMFRIITIYLKPVIPSITKKIEDFLNLKDLTWIDINKKLENNHKIKNYSFFLKRVENKSIINLISNDKNKPERKANMKNITSDETSADMEIVEISDFLKLDLRIAKIVEASYVDKSDKLLKLIVEIENSEKKQVFAGIKSHYKPDELIGKLTLFINNLKPRKMRFGESQGMVLAASNKDGEIFLLSPDKGATQGLKVM